MRSREFERLVRDHHGAVRAFAHSLASTATLAEEAVADTFVRAWTYQDSFRGTGSIEGWLLRICRHRVIDLERRERREVEIREALRHRATESSPGPSDLLDTIAGLGRHHREVLVVCGVLGYDYESASVILDLPVGTVRSRLHRARRELAALLSEKSIEPTRDRETA